MNKYFYEPIIKSRPRTSLIPLTLEASTNASVEQLSCGSVLRINMNQEDVILAKPQSISCSFGLLSRSLNLDSVLESSSRKLFGGSFYYEKYIALQKASLIVSPSRPGDILMMDLDATKDLIFRHDTFLASLGKIHINASNIGFGLRNTALFHGLARGQGTIFLSKEGGMYSIYLKADQECILDPEVLVGWESNMKLYPVDIDQIPIQKATWKSLEWMTKKGIPFRHLAESALFYFTKAYRALITRYRYYILGQKGVYKIKGPGQFFLSSLRVKLK